MLIDSASSPPGANALRRVLGDAVLITEEHVHVPVVQICPDVIQPSLSALHDNLGLDRLSCVIAQECEDHYESVYHPKSYNDSIQEVSVVIPTPRPDPVSESAASVFRMAEWHEREAYGLVGT